ncbi:glycoside hydrolase family 3 protein [Prevotella sp. 10(H)]|uniref:glycoside hydrolase family 3 protein n=1 Tax=Prevotella sp. 10(H) TaxID=1158294 RepID=UPI00055B75D1|nr:glycoside hydrolase family 3 protein [Prevotella sp. 10(H)]
MKKSVIIISALILLTGKTAAQQKPWMDESKPVEQRVEMLVNAMTLEEKIGQMMNSAPAIDRLGIPSYDWWNECLHGVGRAGLATVYPQAIGLAATFDDDALFKSATIISDEARAKHHQFVREGSRQIYQGLTFWSPNINIFRDPRWGRGQETYGEDPHLTTRMGIAFVKGLQGDNPNYYKLVATAKHFAVHSGPEYERHTFDAYPTAYDNWATYLPAFKALVDEGKVASVMCAYNRLDGVPCCGSHPLQVDILRNQWKFDGYIVSDCGAIDDFYRTHKTSPDAATASAEAVIAGTDLECGSSYRALKESVDKGMISEKELDVSLKRLFYARFKLGMFDSDSKNPYAQIPYSVLDSEKHRQDALDMARKSIVLLKNNNRTLPLSKNIKKIAVIGPGATDSVSLLGNYNGTPGKIVTILQGIKDKCGDNIDVVYERGVNLLDDNMVSSVDIWSMMRSGNKKGMKAEYYKGIELKGKPQLTRVETKIDFKGGVADEIAPGIKANWVSVRWTGTFTPEETKDYTFHVTGDDGFRLFVNDEKVIDHFSYHEAMTDYYTLKAEKGKKYNIRLEYFQGDQGAVIRFGAGYMYNTDYDKVLAAVSDADAIVFAGGISPTLEGEEMPVDLPGFFKGDRNTIALPAIQTRMMKELKKTGKPVIFVMQTGSALSINWENENVPAIINSWYGGQAAGVAIADVLFGDYNPAGRLPVTFYKSDNDLPPYEDYNMAGRTYRYFEKEPLYPFGHGLSYTSFVYSDLKVNKKSRLGENIPVSVTVQNTGENDGDEVVQLYISHEKNAAQIIPITELKGFKRIFLRKGEKKTVNFTLSPNDLGIIDGAGNLIKEAGNIKIFAGGGQPRYSKNGVDAVTELID